MYIVKYWVYNNLRSKMFQCLSDAITFSVYTAPFQSVHTIDLIKE